MILDIHDRLEAEMHDKPEGVSVLVVATADQRQFVEQAAAILAAEQYPSAILTGKVLLVELDAFGPDHHEVVLEVR